MTIGIDEQATLALIEAARGGNRDAFAAIFRSHHRRIFTLCLRMTGDTGSAEDLTQDTFVRVWRNLDSFRGGAKFSTWLHRIAVNTVISHTRRHRHWLSWRRESPDTVPELPAPAEFPGTQRDLESAIVQLPERARQVFVLVDVEGYTHDEAAAALKIAPGTSKAHLFRARSLLRELLE
ncbi:MAG: RNA polymerase sigma factor [Pseudomonadales bacterium]|nr:RNA polymerase sigma factor [Pseudomonadales bacterium]